MVNGMGQYLTSPLERSSGHFLQEQVLSQQQRTQAVCFGSTYVPLNDFDLQGLRGGQVKINTTTTATTTITSWSITILGYSDPVPLKYYMGPPHVVTGGDSTRSCAALAALSQALHQTQQCAMATFTKHADLTLAALLPYPPDQQNDQPRHLLMLQLPFCHNVPKLRLPTLPSIVPSAQQEACRQLIHAMFINHANTPPRFRIPPFDSFNKPFCTGPCIPRRRL